MTAPAYLTASRRFHDDEKAHLESLLRRSPDDRDLLAAYFDLLTEISRTNLGIQTCRMPHVRTPVAFRANTSDVSNMRQIFFHREYAFDQPVPPGRILDLGAYCGYAALFLANYYDNAEIFCVEPSAANFAVLTINTASYPNIRRINAAAWGRPGKLALARRVDGHWGTLFGEREDGATAEVPAHTVGELLRFADWPSADFVKCDIEGGEFEVFSDPAAIGWISRTYCISVETHDRFRDGAAAAVANAVPQDLFARGRSGEFVVFSRIIDAAAVPRRVMPLLIGAGAARPIALELVNVQRARWGFEAVDDETLQLHPNSPGQPPAEMRARLRLAGHARFSASCHLAGDGQHAVVFTVRIGSPGGETAERAVEVAPGETADLSLAFPAIDGACDLVLATAMAPGAVNNGFAWARWIRPTLA
jgi:FkbM family methyltransferase